MFNKILIANRGEIACRVIETAQKMGIATVAVFSDADRHAKFVEMADEAIYLGNSESSESYLRTDKVLQAAKQTGAQAIHPGYGFLSENAAFAQQCSDQNLVFIGPPVAAIVAMGSKSQAKALMEAAKVPLVPGYHGDEQSRDFLQSQADKMGYPVLLKASAGGGGKGMRVVESSSEFSAAFESAKRESLSSFGDDKLLIEKYIRLPRHVEIQVFFDNHGNGVYLFERDCSIQRRHQKVIEEAPAPNISAPVRKAMGEAALNCAKAINYSGAGTVEFLLDKDENFYFMEMNTRLQVEHPVTEMITGIDLVEWQIRVANNEVLPAKQDEVKRHGHAFEVRIYAEDPYNNFLPATGKIRHLSTPSLSQHIRIDSGVRENDIISVYYDPMIAKLIVWDENRKLAIARMKSALAAYQLSGLANNISFVAKIFDHDDFICEKLSTGFIEQHQEMLLKSPQASERAHLMAAIKYVASNFTLAPSKDTNQELINPWHSKIAWRLNQSNSESFSLIHRNEEFNFEIHHAPNAELGRNAETLHFEISFNGKLHKVGVSIAKTRHHRTYKNSALETNLDGHLFHYNAFRHEDSIDLFFESHCWEYRVKKPLKADTDLHSEKSLCAPMHGKVIALNAKKGEFVEKGQVLVVMEAMKMEHSIRAATAGLVVDCRCKVGDLVEEGFELIELSDA